MTDALKKREVAELEVGQYRGSYEDEGLWRDGSVWDYEVGKEIRTNRLELYSPWNINIILQNISYESDYMKKNN